MINKIIQEQLEKTSAPIGEYDEIRHQYVIHKYTEPVFDLNTYYLVELDSTLTNPTGNPVLVSNWNKGTYPKYNYMKIVVNKKFGKDMIQVDAIYYDNVSKKDILEMWSGWLPISQIRIISKL